MPDQRLTWRMTRFLAESTETDADNPPTDDTGLTGLRAIADEDAIAAARAARRSRRGERSATADEDAVTLARAARSGRQ